MFVDICTILSSHLKEYQKAVKRHEKTPSNSIESLYKKSHLIYDENNKKIQSADHCTNILRIVFKELVPWELWDTPHSELLVRILSKKLDNFIDNTLAEPAWLNDKILTILKGKVDPTSTEEKKEAIVIPEEQISEVKEEPPSIESALSSLITKGTAPILQRAINEDINEVPGVETIENIVEEVPVTSTEPLDIKSSPILRQRRGRQGRNEVKIYDRIIEGGCTFVYTAYIVLRVLHLQINSAGEEVNPHC